MIRYSLFAVMCCAVTVGCSDVDDDMFMSSAGIYDPNVVNFMSQTTKTVSCDIDVIKSDANGFVVYGLEYGDSSWFEYIDGSGYAYNETTGQWEWASGDVPYWSYPFKQMNFYACYPSSAAGFTLTDVAPSMIVGDITVEPSVVDQMDYLAASSGDILSIPTRGMQPLDFTHIMSKVTFSMLQDEGVLTVIRQLGLENIITKGSYDYVNSVWRNISNVNIGSFDDYIGSAGPYAKYGVDGKIDPIVVGDHYFLLVPQSGGDEEGQTPIWDGSVTIGDSGELEPNGAYISILYRASLNNDTEDYIGHAYRRTSPNNSEWPKSSYYYSVYKRNGGKYTGPLYIKAGFKLSPEQLDWEAGKEYDYSLWLNNSGGIYLSDYYYDVDGTNTKIRIDCEPTIGDPVIHIDVDIDVTIKGWYSWEAIPLEER